VNENTDGAISIEDAVTRLLEPEAPGVEEDQAEDETEAEGTGDSNPEDEVEEAAGDEPEEDPEFDITTPEGERKLKLSELREGYLRLADYTRKTQAAAQERKAAEAVKAEAEAAKQQYMESLQYWAVPVAQEPDWAALARSKPPQEFLAIKADWDARQGKAQRAREAWEQAQAEERVRKVQSERDKLLEAIPEWRDQAKAKADAEKMMARAKDYGFSPEELAEVTDHRVFRALRDAAAYRELQEAKPAVTKKVAPVQPALKPGAKPAPSKTGDREVLRKKLKETGDARVAARLLLS
jgi:hypothetical protein